MRISDIVITIIGLTFIAIIMYQHDDFTHLKEDYNKKFNKDKKSKNKQNKSKKSNDDEDEEDEEE